ncbi:CHAT domain-containing protein [Frankia nepalensis]|uniref:CHAT domain-containing protein n=1 Tax=Frankia nepalensis TaxID=1836974 RepID=A0A937RHF1_9ACTN|nr:CHAT domain-containing protein [Frankia nepalensis]MBL7502820.1 CHAT domain-containing protein [Frankia nepalensis]MBL7515275.1 CHAT domain-containing protein [Frankia nepalensis]MBL7632286.1 CHAT domain-containing protein [Frankia nepalensis]
MKLNEALRWRYRRSGSESDLREAIEVLERSAFGWPARGNLRAALLIALSCTLRQRAERSGSREDHDAAVAAADDAIVSAANGVNHTEALSTAAAAFLLRFNRYKAPDDAENAVRLTRAALEANHEGAAAACFFLERLGSALASRYSVSGDLADLDEAIRRSRESADLTPAGSIELVIRLANLCHFLTLRFEATGSGEDLDDSIALGRQGATLLSANDPTGPLVLTNLSSSFLMRYQRAHDSDDLNGAVTIGREALRISSPNHPERSRQYGCLTSALMLRAQRDTNPDDLEEALSLARESLRSTDPAHPDFPRSLSRLGHALRAAYQMTNDLVYIDEAVVVLSAGVAARPNTHPDYGSDLSNLAGVVRLRWEKTHRAEDLKAAIALNEQAAAKYGAQHPERARCLCNLGNDLRIRFAESGNRADFDASVDAFRQAFEVESAMPSTRLQAAVGRGRMLARDQQWRAATDAYTDAIDLLYVVVSPTLRRSDQENILGTVHGLAADAAACCLASGDRRRALVLWEQARGVIFNQELGFAEELRRLAEHDSDLAEELSKAWEEISRQPPRRTIESTLSLVSPTPVSDSQANEYEKEWGRTSQEFTRRLTQVRQKSGFERFLRPLLSDDELAQAAEGGFVVAVNVSQFGSHALIITPTEVLDPIALPGLTPDSAREQVIAVLQAMTNSDAPDRSATGHNAGETTLSHALAWLWDVIAGPVLANLPEVEHNGPAGRARLWWCTTGLLSFLPIHMAGHHDTRAAEVPKTVVDRYICSYTPTIRALAIAKRHASALQTSGRTSHNSLRILAIAMPSTPGESNLPGAEVEVESLQVQFPGRVTVLSGEAATHDAVLRAIPAATWSHFACHAHVDPRVPSQSHLLLADHRQRPLTAAHVAGLHLEHAELAYLSACSTAQTTAQLADEVIHVASAFQLAGYRHVIATLWPVGDAAAIRHAQHLYRALTEPDPVDPATALSNTTRRLRDRHPDIPSLWASHIHTGA